MSRVFVTGGAGKAGRAVVRDLLEHGYDVVSVDLVRHPGLAEGQQLVVDPRRLHFFDPATSLALADASRSSLVAS
jgi:nucleoside-diphosphate-sugar epimerase